MTTRGGRSLAAACRSGRILATGAALLLAVSGCSGPSDPVGESGLTWITKPTTGAGDTALTRGTIADRGGCMVLEHGGSISHLVFEDSDPRPETYAIGDVVELGGSGAEQVWKGLHIPEACAGATQFWSVLPE